MLGKIKRDTSKEMSNKKTSKGSKRFDEVIVLLFIV
jgi:hypothetical protein